MTLIYPLLALIVGVLILGYGADVFVESSAGIARRFNISAVVIGLTLVAFGTSAPEMAVNVMAAAQGKSGLVYGNVVGSNIFNILIVLGLCAAVAPLAVKGQLIRIDIPFMAVISLLLWWQSADGELSWNESLLLLVLLVSYIVVQVRLSRTEAKAVAEEFEDVPGKRERSLLVQSLLIPVGLGMLVGGARMFVYGASEIAVLWGVSEQVIGLTIVSAGTSLPELATSVAATLKGEREIAVGNVVGSNIFNILAVMGLSGIVTADPVIADEAMRGIDIPLMVLAAIALAPLARFREKFERPVGVLFVLTYVVYVVHLIGRA